MKAKYEVPKPEKNVVVTMTNSERHCIQEFIGNTSKADRKDLVGPYLYTDEVDKAICDLFHALVNMDTADD